MKKLWPFLIPVLMGMVACSTQPQPPPDITDMVIATLTAGAPSAPQVDLPQPTLTPEQNFFLSLDVLRNSAYHSPDWGEFQLAEGIFYRTPPNPQESPENYTTRMLDLVAYGDINLDGMEDAVVFLITQNGGTGHFVEMAAVLNLNGAASNISTLYLGDRIIVESATVQGGGISLALVVQGPNDSLSGPGQKETRNYRFDGAQLVRLP